jgi:tRNA (guanine-N7-)-methyltransferase
MSASVRHGRKFDPGPVGVTPRELGALPDDLLSNPDAGRVDPRRWFAQSELPLEIEIGSGKGTFLLNQALASPKTNLLGIERAGEFFAYAADRVRRRGLTNVRLLHADAVEFLRWRCPPAVVAAIHLYYSDPWPKKRHHKHRVLQDLFLAEAWRVLEPGGELRLVTDHDELWEWYQEQLARWSSPERAPEAWRLLRTLPRGANVAESAAPAPFQLRPFEPPPWVEERELVGTNYERKMCGDRKQPHAAVLRKTVMA